MMPTTLMTAMREGALVCAIAGIAIATPAVAQFAKPEDAIQYRKAAMTMQATHFGRIAAMAGGRAPFDAKVAAENLGDPHAAQQSYEKALDLEPEDVTTLHAFARLCGEGERWTRAVELREQPLDLGDDQLRSALGQIRLHGLSVVVFLAHPFPHEVADHSGDARVVLCRPHPRPVSGLFFESYGHVFHATQE